MINIAEILKNVPTGTKLYSPLFGDVTFVSVDSNNDYPIIIRANLNGIFDGFTETGCYCVDYPDAECVLFPSKENRDWSTFMIERDKKMIV